MISTGGPNGNESGQFVYIPRDVTGLIHGNGNCGARTQQTLRNPGL